MSIIKNITPESKNSGFTLVEIMIAVFVLAIGLLGMAGLQMASLKNSHSAYLRTQAVEYAYDISDRMRANPIGILSAGALAGGGFDNQTPTENTNCYYDPVAGTTTGCTPTQMAGNDLFELITYGAGSKLSSCSATPAPCSIVCLDSTPTDLVAPFATPTAPRCDGLGNVFAIKVWWTDDRSGNDKLFVTTVGF